MFFAQIESVPAETLKNVMLIILGILGAAYYLKEIFFSKKAPQPFEVREAKQYVHTDVFDQFVADNLRQHENLFSKIGGVERGARAHLDVKLDQMQRSSEEGRDKLHDRINEVLSAVSEVRGTVNEMKR
jgi:hypothetical protein